MRGAALLLAGLALVSAAAESRGGAPAETEFPGKFCATGVVLDDPPVTNRGLDIVVPPAGAEREPVAFFLVHGGGWKGGHRGQYYPLLWYLGQRGHIAAATGYRLRNPKTTAFDQLLDIRQSYQYFVDYLRRTTGVERPRVVVMGSSAGGHLGALLAYTRPGECGEPETFKDYTPPASAAVWIPPVAALLVCAPYRLTPWEDMDKENWGSIQAAVGRKYGPESEEAFLRLSPSRYVKPGVCPTFLICAEHEKYFPHYLSREWRDALTAAKVRCDMKIYAGQNHGFLYYCDSRTQKEALTDALAFVRSLDTQ